MTPDQTTRRHVRPTSATDEIAMEFAQATALLNAGGQAFRKLGAADRQILARWLAAARARGIDTAEDLGLRPWPEPGADIIIGLFKPGHLLASWLVVGQAGTWAVACCADGTVSPRLQSLAEALARVWPGNNTCVGPQ